MGKVCIRCPSPCYILLLRNRVGSLIVKMSHTLTCRCVHSATLGKGESDDTLVRIRRGDLEGKGEVVLVFGKQVPSEFLLLDSLVNIHVRTLMSTGMVGPSSEILWTTQELMSL